MMLTSRVTSSPMIAKLQRAKPTAADEPLDWETSYREASMLVEHADCRVLPQHDPPDRRLRNRIIVANAVAWIAIIALIRLIFF
jgi:predicted nuclease with RNAse H fold